MTSDTIPNLWSNDIRVDVLTPLAILQTQKEQLSRITRGILQAEIIKGESKENRVFLHFDIFASALGYRHRLLIANHDHILVYPVQVDSGFLEQVTDDPDEPTAATAGTDEEFMLLIRKIFQSARVRSIVQALIARSNELSAQTPNNAQKEATEEDTKDQS